MNVAAEPSTPSLPPALQGILRSLPDRDFAGRLEKVYRAAANAVARLTDMDLLRYETSTAQESADLSLFEQLAPVIGNTVMDVNALLAVIRATFPEQRSADLDEILTQAVDEGDIPAGLDLPSRMRAAETTLGIARDQLTAEITKLGETVRSPAVVSDHWELLAQLQAFRTRFREQIGSLVHRTASAFDDVPRKDVVPGHAEEIRAAIQVRATVADLIRILGARREKVREAEPEDVQWNAEQLQKEMDVFGQTPAYRALRAQDKRMLIEFRQKIRSVLSDGDLSKADLESLLDAYASFIEGLASTANPAMLKENDRAVWAAAGVRLEQAQSKLQGDPPAAARALQDAAQAAQALYGRDHRLDGFLRKSRKGALAQLEGAELSATLDVFRELLAGLPVLEG